MKKVFVWIISIIITLAAVVYQRATGPTYDKKVAVEIEGAEYKLKLKRSHGGESDCQIGLAIADQLVTAKLSYRRYPASGTWSDILMERHENSLTAFLPHQPPAGKLEYKVVLEKNGQVYPLDGGKPIVIRFKGDVPAVVLIPHILLMFIAMFLSNLAGIMALFRINKYKFYGIITLVTLFAGGLILGPAVQWYAFGEAWAGVPFAWDLTDNKTLLAFIFWVIAWLMNRGKDRPVYTAVAALVMLAVYCIPHSMFGSELDPETGKVIQGFIPLYF